MTSIIKVPHPTLRQEAQVVETVDDSLREILRQLDDTLRHQRNPKGVGLAAPQIDHSWRVFATFLPPEPEGKDAVLRLFINPEIIDHSDHVTFGPDKEQPILEGCLSIPKLYGPVPRFETVKVRYQEVKGSELIEKTDAFSDYAARVMQHEYDHLNGILFTDYSVRYDLPVYQENKVSKKLEEIDPRALEMWS